MPSRSPSDQGAVRYTTEIQNHFKQLPGCRYDPARHVLDNLATHIQYRSLKPEQHAADLLFDGLADVVRASDGPFSPTSGILAYAQKACALRFPGANFDPKQGIQANVVRLRACPQWKGKWKCGQSLTSAQKSLRKKIVKQMRLDWASTRQTRTRNMQANGMIGNPSSIQVSVASSTTKATSVSLDEIEKLLQKVAQAFFAKYKGFQYRASETAVNNFLSFIKFMNPKRASIVDEYLYLLLIRAIDAMQPKAIDRKWDKDYAGKFFDKYEYFQRTPGSTLHKELNRLMTHKQWKAPPKKVTQSPLEILTQIVSSRIAADVKLRLKNHPRLSVLADSERIISSKSTAIRKPEIARVSQPPSGQSNMAVPDTIQCWLEQFPNFKADPTESLTTEFDRLALAQNWSHKSKTYKNQRAQFLTRQFEDEWSEIAYTPDDSDDEDGEGGHHGVNIDRAYKLSQWQDLCNELGIEPMPKTQTQCRKALEKINVNIVDLLEARRVNKTNGDGSVAVRRFETAGALGKYIRQNPEKIFSKGQAKRQGALRALLIHVFGSPSAKRQLA